MKGPLRLVRSDKIGGYTNTGTIYEWSEAKAYLMIDRVSFKGKTGAILCYYNPPVHQVGNPGLDAYLDGLEVAMKKRDEFEFLLLYGANDPVHAGGDIKESLNKLDITLKEKRRKEDAGASADEISHLFDWADNRLKKGIALHRSVRRIAQYLRVVGVCGGGTRFGGSAEIPLMADFLVGDSRSAVCFSEAMIGLIPGWGGVARTLIKAGPTNAAYMAKTSREVKADQLKRIGIYNVVVDIPFPFPKRNKTGDPSADKANYLDGLDVHNDETGRLLLPEALEVGVCDVKDIPIVDQEERLILASDEEISLEVANRKDPQTYSSLWGRSLRDLGDEIARLGRPLAPQSIEALDNLLTGYDPFSFDEDQFVRKEMELDAGLYRDTKFRAGLVATLEQRVADYREVS